jgi:hypothetical protein
LEDEFMKTETTTALTFTFSGLVTDLSPGDITLTNGTGRASAVDFTGGRLLIAIEQAGNISVSINKEGIEAGPKTVSIHKGVEAPPATKIAILSLPETTCYGRNQTFSPAGLKVGWLYSDGSTEEIPTEGYSLSEPKMDRYTTSGPGNLSAPLILR